VAVATFAGFAIGGMAVQALHAQAKPRAYAVIEVDVVNQDAFFKEFFAVKTIMDQGGKFLARGGKLVNIEGPAFLASDHKRLTLVEFENMEKAQATFTTLEGSVINTQSSGSLVSKAPHNNHTTGWQDVPKVALSGGRRLLDFSAGIGA
jgi:uncharacterized protein (DUF1330 family)